MPLPRTTNRRRGRRRSQTFQNIHEEDFRVRKEKGGAGIFSSLAPPLLPFFFPAKKISYGIGIPPLNRFLGIGEGGKGRTAIKLRIERKADKKGKEAK